MGACGGADWLLWGAETACGGQRTTRLATQMEELADWRAGREMQEEERREPSHCRREIGDALLANRDCEPIFIQTRTLESAPEASPNRHPSACVTRSNSINRMIGQHLAEYRHKTARGYYFVLDQGCALAVRPSIYLFCRIISNWKLDLRNITR